MSGADLSAKVVSRFEVDAAILTCNRAAALALACAAAVSGSHQGGVVLQRGHHISINGASIGDLVELADGYLIEVGSIDRCRLKEVEAALEAADTGVFVLGTKTELVDLPSFLYACRDGGKPSIVEANDSTDWVNLVDGGAELVTGHAGRLIEGAELGLIIGSERWVQACREISTGLEILCAPSSADLARFGDLVDRSSDQI